MSTAAPARSRHRPDIDDAFKWNLSDIYPDWETWDRARAELNGLIDRYAAFKGTLACAEQDAVTHPRGAPVLQLGLAI